MIVGLTSCVRHTTTMALPIEERISRFIAERDLIRPSDALLLMVSGGADSMCLLHVMTRIHSGRIGVLTFDHGLRPDAFHEVELVRAAGDALGVPVITRRLGLAPGAAVQQRARDARRDEARRVAAAEGFDRIVTGHTATDQAETVLFRIARGTGRDGAVGMRAQGAVTRPLLAVSRDETRGWCAANGVVYVDDPSNDDTRFARARVRSGLLPALLDVHPGADRAVTRFAELLDDEGALIGALVDAASARCATATGLDLERLRHEDVPLQRLLVRRLLADAGIAADAVWVREALALARRGNGSRDVEGGRITVWRGELVAEAVASPPPDPVRLGVPGEVRYGDRIIRASRSVAEAPDPDRVDLRIDGALTVRGPHPGDRIALAGGGRQAVGRLLAAAGVPADRRPSVPVVACGGHVVWVSGYRAGVDVLAPPGTPATRLELL